MEERVQTAAMHGTGSYVKSSLRSGFQMLRVGPGRVGSSGRSEIRSCGSGIRLEPAEYAGCSLGSLRG